MLGMSFPPLTASTACLSVCLSLSVLTVLSRTKRWATQTQRACAVGPVSG